MMTEIWMTEVGLGLEKLEDAILLALKMEEEAASHGMQMAPSSWKRQRIRFSPRSSRRSMNLLMPVSIP